MNDIMCEIIYNQGRLKENLSIQNLILVMNPQHHTWNRHLMANLEKEQLKIESEIKALKEKVKDTHFMQEVA